MKILSWPSGSVHAAKYRESLRRQDGHQKGTDELLSIAERQERQLSGVVDNDLYGTVSSSLASSRESETQFPLSLSPTTHALSSAEYGEVDARSSEFPVSSPNAGQQFAELLQDHSGTGIDQFGTTNAFHSNGPEGYKIGRTPPRSADSSSKIFRFLNF